MSAPIITASSHTHAGTAPPGYQNEWVTHTVHWHGFTSLSTVRGAKFYSPEFILLGNQWRLAIYPGGREDAEEGMVSLGLDNRSNKAMEIDLGFSVNDANGKQVSYEQSGTPCNFAPVGVAKSRWGFPNFATRLTLLSSLVNGALVIEIQMRLADHTKPVPPPFIPENPSSCKTIQGVFLEEKYSDIVFEVGEGNGKGNARKVAKTTSVTFPAHRIIVSNCSKTLAELCASGGVDNGTTQIQIDNVSPDIFRLLLSYIYGMTISIDDMKSHAKEIIDAADRFGVTSLKLEAELSLVNNTLFDIENVKELLLYADSKNCALLKEAAMDYMLENKDVVLKNIRFDDAPGSLVSDVFAAIARAETMKDDSASHFHSMRISELRQMVHDKGLEVDGSREMLIALLEKVLNSEQT
jgi:hypothetical protein